MGLKLSVTPPSAAAICWMPFVTWLPSPVAAVCWIVSLPVAVPWTALLMTSELLVAFLPNRPPRRPPAMPPTMLPIGPKARPPSAPPISLPALLVLTPSAPTIDPASWPVDAPANAVPTVLPKSDPLSPNTLVNRSPSVCEVALLKSLNPCWMPPSTPSLPLAAATPFKPDVVSRPKTLPILPPKASAITVPIEPAVDLNASEKLVPIE